MRSCPGGILAAKVGGVIWFVSLGINQTSGDHITYADNIGWTELCYITCDLENHDLEESGQAKIRWT